MRHLMASVVIAASVLLPASGVTFAADPHTSGTTGQPNQSCDRLMLMVLLTPSQYDVACFQQSQQVP